MKTTLQSRLFLLPMLIFVLVATGLPDMAKAQNHCYTCPTYDYGPFTPGQTWSTHSDAFGSTYCRFYAFQLTAGNQYEFSLCATDGGTADFDSYLELYDGTCTIVAGNDDYCSTQSYIAYTPLVNGTFYLKVRGYSSAFGSYTLAYKGPTLCNTCPVTDFSITPTPTFQTHSSSVVLGGCKQYLVSLSAGSTATFSFCQGGGTADYDTYLTLRDAACNVLVSNDDACGVYSELIYTVPTTGSYYLEVNSCCTGSSSGNYTLAYSQTLAPPPSYCTPTYSNACTTDDFIDGFSTTAGLTNITNNSSGCNGQTNNYIYYSAMTVSQYAGQSFNFTVLSGYYSQGFAIWVDWNDNGDFADLGEAVWNSATTGTSFTGSISIPSGTTTGVKRMRVRSAYGLVPGDPCSNESYGETEDYNLDVAAPMSYCTPVFAYACSSDDYINNFSTTGGVSNITNNGSSCNGQTDNYIFYSTMTVSQYEALGFNISVQSGSSYSQGFGIWVDWNNDGDFSDLNEAAWNSGTYGTQVFTGTITIPAGTTPGIKRMRVMCEYVNVPSDPCGILYDFGETEDYNLEVLPALTGPCASAINIAACGSSNTQTFNVSGTGSWDSNFCGYSTPGVEQIYSFTPTVSGIYRIEVTNTNSEWVDYFWKTGACDATAWNCISDVYSPAIYGNMNWNAGTTYYILLDPEGTANAIHEFFITCPALPLSCPPGSISETEPICITDYVDSINGGCNSTPNVFDTIPSCGGIICGTSGVYDYQGSSYRDTDWFIFTTTDSTDVYLEINADFDVLIGLIDGNYGCPVSVFLTNTSAPAGVTATLSYVVGPGTWYVWVGPDNWNAWPCGSLYVLDFQTVLKAPALTAAANPACGSTTIDPVADVSLTKYYWQGTSCGNSTTNPASVAYPVTASGTYFIRGHNPNTGCWSSYCDSISITVLPVMPDPLVTDDTICTGATATLYASGTGLQWWDDPVAGNLIGTGNSYTTPALTDTMVVYVESASVNSSLHTTSAAGNQQNGNMFDVTIINDLVIDSIYISPELPGSYNLEVYYKTGTYVGSETNASAWTLHQTIPINAPGGFPYKIDINPLNLSAGQTYGMYITSSDPNQYLNYTNGANTYSDANMTITTGDGIAYPFAGIFTPRTWNGTLVYSITTCPSNRIPATAYVIDAPVAPTVIYGTDSLCAGQNGVIYNVIADPSVTLYTWNYTGSNVSPTFNAVGDTAWADFLPNATGGDLTVYGENLCGTSAISPVFTVVVNPLPSPAGAIAGDDSICAGETAVAYSIAALPGVTNYLWTYSGTGATIYGNTESITMDFALNATSGTLTITPQNNCGDGTPATMAIVVSPLPDHTGSISGPDTVCPGQNGVAYSVPPVPFATTYLWSYTGSDATINGNTENITIDFGANATAGTLTVTPQNACGDGLVSAGFSINIGAWPSAAGSITGTDTVCAGQSGIAYSISAVSGATAYQWIYTGTDVTINGSGTAVNLDFGSAASSGILTVTPQNACGDGAASPDFNIFVDICTGIAENDFGATTELMPNPNNGNFRCVITVDIPESCKMAVTDANGRVVWAQTIALHAGVNTIDFDLTYLATGTYFLQGCGNHMQFRKVFVLNK